MALKDLPRGLWDRGGGPGTPLRFANRSVPGNTELADGTGGGDYRPIVNQVVPISWQQLQGNGSEPPANQNTAASILANNRIDQMLAYLRDTSVSGSEKSLRAKLRIMVRVVVGSYNRSPLWVRNRPGIGSFDLLDVPDVSGSCLDHGTAVHSTKGAYSCTPKWWEPSILAYYTGLIEALADKYDSEPEILAFVVSILAPDYPEIQIRKFRVDGDDNDPGSTINKTNYTAAGYTQAADDAAKLAIVDACNAFDDTRCLFYLSSTETYSGNVTTFSSAPTVTFAQEIRNRIGQKGILSNAFLKAPDLQGFRGGIVALGAPLGWQTATYNQIGAAWEPVLEEVYAGAGTHVELIGETTTGTLTSRPFFMQGPANNGRVQYPIAADTDGYGNPSNGLQYWSDRINSTTDLYVWAMDWQRRLVQR